MANENISETGLEIVRRTIETFSEAKKSFDSLAEFMHEKSGEPDITDFEHPMWLKHSKLTREMSNYCADMLECYREMEALASRIKAAQALAREEITEQQAWLN